MSNQFIHIGLPRTATTFLQQKVFAKMEDYNYHGPATTQYHPAFNQLMFADESFYSEKRKNEVKPFLNEEKLILSNENFSGQSLYLNFTNRSRTARRLSELLPDATVILFIRNQTDLLRSHYGINLQWKETKTFEEFINTHERGRKLPDPGGPHTGYYDTYRGTEPLDGYNFHALVKLYRSLFPKVEIFLYEDLLMAPENVMDRMENIFKTSFSGEVRSSFTSKNKINRGVSEKTARKLRKLNRYYDLAISHPTLLGLFNKRKRQLMKGNKNDDAIKVPSVLSQKIKKHFRPSNEELNKEYPELNLNRYAEEYFLDQG